MINLLPPDTHKDIVYARRNRSLLRWLIACSVGVCVILVIIGFGWLYLRSEIKTQSQQIAATQEQLKKNKLEDTQKRIEEISNSLKLAVSVLSREILFSKLLKEIGATMPRGTALTNLTITSVKGGIDLQANAESYQAGTQIPLNLVDPKNKIFEKADITEISCPNKAITDTGYPCTVKIRALFKEKNQFLFLSKDAAAVKQ